MSRNLGWGKSFACNESLAERLRELDAAGAVMLDRWKVVYAPLTPEEIGSDSSASSASSQEDKKKQDKKSKTKKEKEKEKEKGKEKEKEKEKDKESEKGKEKKNEAEPHHDAAKKIACVMNNYCSFGTDAKIVLGKHPPPNFLLVMI